MLSIILILLTFSSSSIFAVSDSQWLSFKKQYEKSYPANLEDWIRRELYQDSLDEVNEFNAKQAIRLGYRIGANQYSDLTKLELRRLGGTRTSANVTNSPRAQQFLAGILNSSNQKIVPEHIDWTKQANRVGRVKNQGNCRSSWAFAATGVLEGQIVARGFGKNLSELSEANLIDCLHGNTCNVGLVEPSFWYAQNNGLVSEAVYPFTGQKSNCKAPLLSSSPIVMRDQGYAILPEGDEDALKRVVATYGPVAAVLPWADDNNINFVKYKSGIFYSEENSKANTTDQCRTKRNHAVLIVGYGRDFIGGDYWIVKNSYGKSWGEQGYIRMARNRKNNSGIACNAMIAIF